VFPVQSGFRGICQQNKTNVKKEVEKRRRTTKERKASKKEVTKVESEVNEKGKIIYTNRKKGRENERLVERKKK
jgi:hypothetical protein